MIRGLVIALAAASVFLVSCGIPTATPTPTEGRVSVEGSSSTVRAARRLFDGAPPVIPHRAFGAACTSCHNERGMAVPDVGFAPASPHGSTPGLGTEARCQQCHVFQLTDRPWRETTFAGFRRAPWGERAHPLAPPTIPHPLLLREDCLACHAGPGARQEIRTDHPHRDRCQQCHVSQQTAGEASFATPVETSGPEENGPEESGPEETRG